MKLVLHDESMMRDYGNVFWDKDDKEKHKENKEKCPSGAYTGQGP